MIFNDNDSSKETDKSQHEENIDGISENIDDQEMILDSRSGNKHNKTSQIFARVFIGILLLCCLVGISLTIVMGIRFYRGDGIFFSPKYPLVLVSNQDKEINYNNNSQYDLTQSSQSVNDYSQKSDESNNNLNKPVYNQKESLSNNLYKPENVSITLLNEEISNLKGLILNLNKSYNDIETRLKNTENKIENPLKNPSIQRMISLIILHDTINRGEYPVDKRIIAEVVSTLDPCAAVLTKFDNLRIPTLLEIVMQFPKVSEEMISESEAVDKNVGFINYLIYLIKKLIKIRFIENSDGDTITALMSRIENNLKNGNMLKASTEWNKVPENVQKPGIFLQNALEAHICSNKIIREELAKFLHKNPL